MKRRWSNAIDYHVGRSQSAEKLAQLADPDLTALLKGLSHDMEC